MKLREIQKQAWEIAEDKGFHEARDDDTPTALALIHSEVSEALESDRGSGEEELAKELRQEALKYTGDRNNTTATMLREAADELESDPIGEELADIIIRVADLAEAEGVDLQSEVEMKMAKNETREHMHGKDY